MVGIDEVGRGPLAGPVMVGVATVPAGFDWRQIPGVTDSKKLTEKKREAIYEAAVVQKEAGVIDFAVAGESAAVIDAVGIVPAINKCLEAALLTVMNRALCGPHEVLVKLDGGLKAPVEYLHQETIIKGDATESVIGLASIVAKVMRDREMVRLAQEYPGYGLEVHKGYGTMRHRQCIGTKGLSAIHRASFCRNCQNS